MKHITTISIANDTNQFDAVVNKMLCEGWKVSSTNCAVYGFNGSADEFYQAILIKETPEDLF